MRFESKRPSKETKKQTNKQTLFCKLKSFFLFWLFFSLFFSLHFVSRLLDNQFCLLSCFAWFDNVLHNNFPKSRVEFFPASFFMILFWAIFQWLLLRWANPSGYFLFFAHTKTNKGVWHIVALPFTFKVMLTQKKNHEKLKYFTMRKPVVFKTSSKRNQNPFKIL